MWPLLLLGLFLVKPQDDVIQTTTSGRSLSQIINRPVVSLPGDDSGVDPMNPWGVTGQ